MQMNRQVVFFVITTLWLFTGLLPVFGTNPPVTNSLINLSQGLLDAESEDYNPELIVEGNTVHALWTNRTSNNEGYLFYCRSTDLGETWEPVKNLYQFKDGSNRATDVYSRRLAVSGNNVYIGFADYDYYNNGTGYIYFSRSSDGGANFTPVTELANSGGGYSALSSCYIRASGGKVALVYRDANYNDNFEGLYCLFSSNSGASFTKTAITDVNTSNISDFQMKDNLLVVVHSYAYYYYGLNVGRVYVSVSGNDGAAFTTNKVSVVYTNTYGDQEKCMSAHDYRYVPKLAVDGNNIHVLFTGNNKQEAWTLLYAHSTNGGQSFEEAVDINKGLISTIQNGQESIVAKNGKIYMEYLSTGGKVYLVRSDNNGATLSDPKGILPDNTDYLKTIWWPQLVIDPSDATGNSFYFGGGSMITWKSVDGGNQFKGAMTLSPILYNHDVRGSALAVDATGNIHWLSKARWLSSYDYDIFYGSKKKQPEPGIENKAYYLEMKRYEKYETTIVPSSPSIEFDSVITAEAWIKMRPGSGFHQNILTKINGYDGAVYQSPGYQIGFDDNYGKRRLSSGIQTDKGEFINWTGSDVKDTLWHHVAFTYDAGAGLNNFKTYLDGLLVAEQTVTGAIIPGDGMLFIGSRYTNQHYDSKHLIDDVRLWNRALTREELMENQVKTLNGSEEGLTLWLNFNDTFKDISGNGNDAIPLCLGELMVSDFDPPVPAFDLYQVANEVSFNNKTTNAIGYLWNFGNTKSSLSANPKHLYPVAGEYDVTLLAMNNTTAASIGGHVTIAGLDRVEPDKAGNLGYTSVSVFGGGLTTTNTTLILRKEGEEDLIGEKLTTPGEGSLAAFFDLYDKALGEWDVVVSRNGIEMVLSKAFTVVPGTEAEPWVNISGRGAILFNMWQTYTINFGNNGNMDAYAVPLWLAITNHEMLAVEFIDFDVVLPDVAYTMGVADQIKAIEISFETDMVLGTPMNAKVFPLVIPVIPANSSNQVRIRIKSPATFDMIAWMNPPWVAYAPEGSGEEKSVQLSESELKLKVAECIMAVLAEGIVDIGTSAIPGVGCVWSVGKQAYQVYQTPPWDEKFSFWGSLWNAAVTVVDCGINLSGVGAVAKGVGIFLANMGGYAKSISDCKQIGKDISNQKRTISAVSSFDPNEMIGPAGFGEFNYISRYSLMPYTILFENKREATAPAHIVTITDTLDLTVFNLSDFGFGSFGWGDTIFSPPGNRLKAFSADIDMRPGLELITRVSAKLDTLTGVVRWEFLSLNPVTMELEEDPLLGFLPPNATSPEGEGFVSFSVGLKPELNTGDEIRNQASIVFDANPPIITNNYLNTLDLDKPQSQVYPLEETSDNYFPVQWSGTDIGSGIAGYTLYVLENDTLLYAWLNNTMETTANFDAVVGSAYKFYSVAMDHVGYKESESGEYDAQTSVTVDVETFDLLKEELIVWPNPVSDWLFVKMDNAPCGMYAVELIFSNGSVIHSRLYDGSELSSGLKMSVENCLPGSYALRMVFGNRTISRNILIR